MRNPGSGIVFSRGELPLFHYNTSIDEANPPAMTANEIDVVNRDPPLSASGELTGAAVIVTFPISVANTQGL
jgi:hypothetical protein